MPRVTKITVREGTTAEWAAADAASGADPTRLLDAGEPGRDTTLNLLKFGNGTDTWADLPPAQSGTYVALENVLKHGAVGDGVTDATAAIQAAIDALPLNTADTGVLTPKGFANGGTVYLPRGRYVVSGTITLKRGIRIMGDGRESTQIISKTAGSVFHYADAGRYVQDEIVFANLSIWQDASVIATSGAAIHVGFGAATVQSTSLICDNMLIEGTFQGLLLEAGIWSSVRNVNVNKTVSHGFVVRWTDGVKTVSTTSTSFDNCYASQCGGSGFHITGGAYITLNGCASDSNVTHGYFLQSGKGHALIACGAEENGDSAVYLDATKGTVLDLNVVYNIATGTRYGVTFNNAVDTVLLGGYFAGSTATGFALHLVAGLGSVVCIGTTFEGMFAASVADFTAKLLHLSAENGLVGTKNNWAIGVVQQPDPAAVFNVGGNADSDSDAGLKVNVFHTGAGAARNVAAFIQAVTANTAVTYPLVIGAFVPAPSKGAASTITRQAGVYAVESSAGGTANAGIMLDAGAGTVPAGNWALYSDSLRDSVLKGPLRMGSGTGPKWQSGTGTPEGVVTAPIGSLFTRTDGGAGTSLYVKESGSGNTGWVAK